MLPVKNGFEPFKKNEPLNGVNLIASMYQKDAQYHIEYYLMYVKDVPWMWSFCPSQGNASILEAWVTINALEVGTSEILHISNFPPLSRATNFM
jgi:hypothetical protein